VGAVFVRAPSPGQNAKWMGSGLSVRREHLKMILIGKQVLVSNTEETIENGSQPYKVNGDALSQDFRVPQFPPTKIGIQLDVLHSKQTGTQKTFTFNCKHEGQNSWSVHR